MAQELNLTKKMTKEEVAQLKELINKAIDAQTEYLIQDRYDGDEDEFQDGYWDGDQDDDDGFLLALCQTLEGLSYLVD